MDNPDDDPPKHPRKTLAERRKEARKAVRLTRQLMEEEALQREREIELAIEQERAREEEEQRLQKKAEQEQRDYEIARDMSTSAPTENPLLLPREEQGQQKARKRGAQTISHDLHCSGCGGTFVGTKSLKMHVRENPLCLKFWGDDMKSLSQKVIDIFKRRRSSRHYKMNRDGELARKKEEYWANSQKQRDRKRIHYKANEEKERERKRVEYAANNQKQKERQAAIRASKAEQKSTLTDRDTFEKEGRYGPIFPCVCCCQLNWYFSMFIQGDLNTLPQEFVDVQHVRENISLFQKQNRFFVCRPCKNDLDRGICPKMSTKNYLECPWKDVPSPLLTINPVRFSAFKYTIIT